MNVYSLIPWFHKKKTNSSIQIKVKIFIYNLMCTESTKEIICNISMFSVDRSGVLLRAHGRKKAITGRSVTAGRGRFLQHRVHQLQRRHPKVPKTWGQRQSQRSCATPRFVPLTDAGYRQVAIGPTHNIERTQHTTAPDHTSLYTIPSAPCRDSHFAVYDT